jgi:hypothetical protein
MHVQTSMHLTTDNTAASVNTFSRRGVYWLEVRGGPSDRLTIFTKTKEARDILAKAFREAMK